MFKLLKYLNKREWLLMAIGVIFIIGKVYFALLMPDFMSNLTQISQGGINATTGEPYELNDIWLNGLYMLLCAVAATVLAFLVSVISVKLAADFSTRLREMVYRKVQSFSHYEIKKFTTPSLITRTTNDITQVQTLIIIGMDIFFKTPITIIWALFKIANKAWQWIAAIMIGVFFMALVIVVIMLIVRRRIKKLQLLTDDLNQVTRENINGIRVVRAYNAEKYQEQKFDQVNQDFTKTNFFTSRSLAMMNPFTTLVNNGVLLAIYWVGAYVINAAELTEYATLYSDMVVFISYGIVIVSAFSILVVMFMVAPRAVVSAKRINEVLETEPIIKEGEGVGETIEKGAIEFKNVTFRYPDGNKNILTDVSFKVKKGETIAFIGGTGCGKSSVVKLASRLYDASDGEVLVDGYNIKDYKKNELCKKIGYAAQSAVMFSGTIHDNISFGDNDADENAINKALEIAQAAKFVKDREGGLEARVSQNATNFSGGEKQRLSIARALARDAEIYIFDDCFSALDYRTEKTLRTALNKEMKDVTCLIVAQRIGTILDVDRIVVLEDGRIVGQGSHDELMKNCPLYQEIAQSQLSEEELG